MIDLVLPGKEKLFRFLRDLGWSEDPATKTPPLLARKRDDFVPLPEGWPEECACVLSLSYGRPDAILLGIRHGLNEVGVRALVHSAGLEITEHNLRPRWMPALRKYFVLVEVAIAPPEGKGPWLSTYLPVDWLSPLVP